MGAIAGSLGLLVLGFATAVIIGAIVIQLLQKVGLAVKILTAIFGIGAIAAGIFWASALGPVGAALVIGTGVGLAGAGIGTALGAFQFGGPVQRTGLFHLEEGETVIPRGGGGGTTFAPNITVHGSAAAGSDPTELARVISEVLFDQMREVGLL